MRHGCGNLPTDMGSCNCPIEVNDALLSDCPREAAA
jgi:hypothetical protein